MKRLFMLVLSLLAPLAALHAAEPAPTDRYNVVWDSPSTNAFGSMPLGNGDVGVNAWAQADGTLHLLIGKTDAWDDNSRIVKVGEVIVHFAQTTFAGKFRQELDLQTGSIVFQTPAGADEAKASEIRL